MTLLHPEWLLALLPLLGLRWLLLRRQRPDAQAIEDIAPHLRAALTIGRHGAGGWLCPPDLMLGAAALMALGGLLSLLDRRLRLGAGARRRAA